MNNNDKFYYAAGVVIYAVSGVDKLYNTWNWIKKFNKAELFK